MICELSSLLLGMVGQLVVCGPVGIMGYLAWRCLTFACLPSAVAVTVSMVSSLVFVGYV